MDDDDDRLPFTALARSGDPDTSHAAAAEVDTKGWMLEFLKVYRHGLPRNGWDIAKVMGMEKRKDTVVPRLAPLRRQGALVEVEPRRPGPTGNSQLTYVITHIGFAILRGDIELQASPPIPLWEQRHILQKWLRRALREGWTNELRTEVLMAYAMHRALTEDEDEP